MDNKTIGDYTAAVTIDGANHFLLIQPGNSSTAYNKISRNVLLGITAQPVDISSVQTLTNKVIGITNTVTVLDTLFTIQDDGDNTKQAKFQLSGITTGTTRTYTLPNVSDTLVSLTASQTLTNKTLTAPAISGGTIDNTTITVDSIAGHSTSTIVTVANLQISNGVLNSANAVTATSIAAGAVQPQALQSGTGSGWAMSSWTPTPTNYTVGNGSVVAKYIQIGKIVFFRFSFILGSTSVISSGPTFSLPVTAVSYNPSSAATPIGWAHYEHTGVTNAEGGLYIANTTTASFGIWGATGTYVTGGAGGLTASVPFSWAASDQILCEGWYEAA